MNWKELLELAEDVIKKHPDAAKGSPEDFLLLRIPEPDRHNGHRVHLFRTRGPLAVIRSGKDGKLNVCVSARAVRDCLLGFGHTSDAIDTANSLTDGMSNVTGEQGETEC